MAACPPPIRRPTLAPQGPPKSAIRGGAAPVPHLKKSAPSQRRAQRSGKRHAVRDGAADRGGRGRFGRGWLGIHAHRGSLHTGFRNIDRTPGVRVERLVRRGGLQSFRPGQGPMEEVMKEVGIQKVSPSVAAERYARFSNPRIMPVFPESASQTVFIRHIRGLDFSKHLPNKPRVTARFRHFPTPSGPCPPRRLPVSWLSESHPRLRFFITTHPGE